MTKRFYLPKSAIAEMETFGEVHIHSPYHITIRGERGLVLAHIWPTASKFVLNTKLLRDFQYKSEQVQFGLWAALKPQLKALKETIHA